MYALKRIPQNLCLKMYALKDMSQNVCLIIYTAMFMLQYYRDHVMSIYE